MAGLIEFHRVKDIFCNGLHNVEDVGDGMVRLYLYANKEDERYLVASIVVPLSSLPDFVIMTIEALADKGSEVAKLFPLMDRLKQH